MFERHSESFTLDVLYGTLEGLIYLIKEAATNIYRVLSNCRRIRSLTRHVGKKEIRGTQEPPFGFSEGETEAQSPID